jgi:hypothetical protein
MQYKLDLLNTPDFPTIVEFHVALFMAIQPHLIARATSQSQANMPTDDAWRYYLTVLYRLYCDTSGKVELVTSDRITKYFNEPVTYYPYPQICKVTLNQER